MIELKIQALDADDLRRQLGALLSGGSVSIVAGTGAVGTGGVGGATEVPKATRKPKDESKPDIAPAPVEETSEQLPQDADPIVETQTPGELTYETDIKPAVLRVNAKHGRPGVEKLLADFGAANAKEIPEARWPELMAAIDKLVG